MIGTKAGWIKKADDQRVAMAVEQIKKLMEQEKGYKNWKQNIPEMEEEYEGETDGGDGDGGSYGSGMSAREYRESLSDPYVDIVKDSINQDDFDVFFHGNNPPHSVNAGRGRKIYIENLNSIEVKMFQEQMKINNISCDVN